MIPSVIKIFVTASFKTGSFTAFEFKGKHIQHTPCPVACQHDEAKEE